MYSIVDKKSDLYWSARNDIELIMDPQKRTRKSTDASVKEESGRWQKDFQGSVGYGEITKVSVIALYFKPVSHAFYL